MFSKSYYILLASISLYWGIAGIARAERNSVAEAIKIPDKLNWVLFPFRANTRVRTILCVMAGYLEISNIVVYGLAFLKKGSLNWENISAVWVILLMAVSLIGGAVDVIRDFIYTERERNMLNKLLRERNMLNKLLNVLFCVFFLIITIGWIAFTIYVLVRIRNELFI